MCPGRASPKKVPSSTVATPLQHQQQLLLLLLSPRHCHETQRRPPKEFCSAAWPPRVEPSAHSTYVVSVAKPVGWVEGGLRRPDHPPPLHIGWQARPCLPGGQKIKASSHRRRRQRPQTGTRSLRSPARWSPLVAAREGAMFGANRAGGGRVCATLRTKGVIVLVKQNQYCRVTSTAHPPLGPPHLAIGSSPSPWA